MSKLDERLELKLKQVIEGINLIPSIREKIEKELNTYIDENKSKEVLDLKLDINSLSEEEKQGLFKVMFRFTKDEDFNPIKALSKKDKKNNDEYTKDFDVDLYYNFDFKMKFTNTKYREKTRKVVRALFRKSAKYELANGKDLYDFSIGELEEFFRSLKAKSLRSIQNSISTVEQYIKFAINNGKTAYKVNNAQFFNSKEKTEELLDKEAEEKMIFDREELMALAMHTDNAQDGVIPALIFDGVSQKKKHGEEFWELTNLTSENIDFENGVIKLEDREVPMSRETSILVKDALKNEYYYSIKGENVRKYKLAESNYVLRGLRGNAKIKWRNINERLARIAEKFDYKYLNATAISYSGQIDYAKTLLNNGMDIDEVVDKVLYRYGVNINPSSQFNLKTRIEKHLS